MAAGTGALLDKSVREASNDHGFALAEAHIQGIMEEVNKILEKQLGLKALERQLHTQGPHKKDPVDVVYDESLCHWQKGFVESLIKNKAWVAKIYEEFRNMGPTPGAIVTKRELVEASLKKDEFYCRVQQDLVEALGKELPENQSSTEEKDGGVAQRLEQQIRQRYEARLKDRRAEIEASVQQIMVIADLDEDEAISFKEYLIYTATEEWKNKAYGPGGLSQPASQHQQITYEEQQSKTNEMMKETKLKVIHALRKRLWRKKEQHTKAALYYTRWYERVTGAQILIAAGVGIVSALGPEESDGVQWEKVTVTCGAAVTTGLISLSNMWELQSRKELHIQAARIFQVLMTDLEFKLEHMYHIEQASPQSAVGFRSLMDYLQSSGQKVIELEQTLPPVPDHIQKDIHLALEDGERKQRSAAQVQGVYYASAPTYAGNYSQASPYSAYYSLALPQHAQAPQPYAGNYSQASPYSAYYSQASPQGAQAPQPYSGNYSQASPYSANYRQASPLQYSAPPAYPQVPQLPQQSAVQEQAPQPQQDSAVQEQVARTPQYSSVNRCCGLLLCIASLALLTAAAYLASTHHGQLWVALVAAMAVAGCLAFLASLWCSGCCGRCLSGHAVRGGPGGQTGYGEGQGSPDEQALMSDFRGSPLLASSEASSMAWAMGSYDERAMMADFRSSGLM